jgi:hypothetical protein
MQTTYGLLKVAKPNVLLPSMITQMICRKVLKEKILSAMVLVLVTHIRLDRVRRTLTTREYSIVQNVP